MQIISNEDNLHEMSNPVFWENNNNNKNTINLSSAEVAQIVVKINITGDLASTYYHIKSGVKKNATYCCNKRIFLFRGILLLLLPLPL